MGLTPGAIRRYARQAKRGTKPPDAVLNAPGRSGFRVADEWDYIADMQDCVRAMGKSSSAMRALNSVLPKQKQKRTAAQEAVTRKLAASSSGAVGHEGTRDGA